MREPTSDDAPVAQGGTVAGSARADLLQIGQVAERTGLGLRTIRFHEGNGLVVHTARSDMASGSTAAPTSPAWS